MGLEINEIVGQQVFLIQTAQAQDVGCYGTGWGRVGPGAGDLQHRSGRQLQPAVAGTKEQTMGGARMFVLGVA